MAQSQGPRIGVIDYYGIRKLSADKVAKMLGVQVGDPLPRSKGDVEDLLERDGAIVRAHLEAACCEDGKAILYVGIEERGRPAFDYRQAPGGPMELSEPLVDAYVKFFGSLREAMRKGEVGEDLTRGHSLMENAETRAAQEAFIPLAKDNLDLIRKVARESGSPEHRAMAVYMLGYAPDKKAIVDDLQYCLQDPEDAVRNHALRALTALSVLAQKEPDLELKVSPTWFVEMLNSIVWTDRHNATMALLTLSESRDQKTLELIRERASPSLIEMAKWQHLPHALPAFILLGRVNGFPEKEIQEAWLKDRADFISEIATPDKKSKRRDRPK